MYLSVEEIALEYFPEVSEELIIALLELFYCDVQDFDHWHLLVFLENKKIQLKIVNTLLLIARNPFSTAIFPEGIFDLEEEKMKNGS